MPYSPRSTQDVLDSLIAAFMVRTKLTAPDPKSNTYLLLKTVASAVSYADYRLWRFRNSFNIANPDITYEDLLERVAELPPGGVVPLGKTNASGAVLTVSRASAAVEQILPAGSSVQRSDAAGSGLTYRTVVPYTFAVGVDALTGCYVACTTAGERGNCGIGVLTRGVNMPTWVISVTNTQALTNGQDAELASALQLRGVQYLSSLARSQRIALEFLARSFVSVDGTRAKFAKVFSDPSVPGYAELIVDDGTGFASLIQPGPTMSGVIPPNGQNLFFHQSPAVSEILQVNAVIGGAPHTFWLSNGEYRSYPELGYVEFPGVGGAISPGSTWEIKDYQVYSGFLAELQKAVNGDVSDPVNFPGWKAEGVRVRVLPPTVEYVSLQVHVVPTQYTDLAALQAQVTNVIVTYCSNLGPGEPLYMSGLNAAVRELPDVLNVQFFNPDGSNTYKGDVYTQPKNVLRTRTDLIQYLASVQV